MAPLLSAENDPISIPDVDVIKKASRRAAASSKYCRHVPITQESRFQPTCPHHMRHSHQVKERQAAKSSRLFAY
jgi:hypothetical protein